MSFGDWYFTRGKKNPGLPDHWAYIYMDLNLGGSLMVNYMTDSPEKCIKCMKDTGREIKYLMMRVPWKQDVSR